MKTSQNTAKYLGMIGLAALTSACKVEIAVPPGGQVHTQSGLFHCLAGQTCSVDVVDTHFDETFEAVASPTPSRAGVNPRTPYAGAQRPPVAYQPAALKIMMRCLQFSPATVNFF